MSAFKLLDDGRPHPGDDEMAPAGFHDVVFGELPDDVVPVYHG